MNRQRPWPAASVRLLSPARGTGAPASPDHAESAPQPTADEPPADAAAAAMARLLEAE